MSADAYDATVAAQRLAADPQRSAFVAANAGSGKTRVLTDRVARLLLAGVKPQRILCITYTKAAAAEMAKRLFELLGKWALADDAKLAAELNKLEGDDVSPRPAGKLSEARRLFAQALETPGGLKIQTIHSFCESVLKRFPLEAGAPPGFAVIDESAAAALARAATEEMARAAGDDARLAAALDRLSERYGPEAVRLLIMNQLASRQKLETALALAGGWTALQTTIAAALGANAGEPPETIIAGFLASVGDRDIERAQAALEKGATTCLGFAQNELAAYLASANQVERFALLASVLLTLTGSPRKKFPDAGSKKADPWCEGFLLDLQKTALTAADRLKAAGNAADTAAFLTLMERALGAYERGKAARAGLDYDDLIAGAHRLFTSVDAAWVRYKLDQGLDHILLDEAQDTSPAQWRVIEGPLEEFFSGAGAREEARTFFAVGDQKQSIYSFQGADAGLFAEKQHDLGKRIEAVAQFKNVPLTLSFRTTSPVLRFVDALFADEAVLEGVSEDRVLKHQVKREGEAGVVEIWPRVPYPKKPEANAWDAPVDAPAEENQTGRLAGAVCARIKGWLDGGETLDSQDRPVRPGDVMILVQSRGPLFHEMIRALTTAGVPVAGADKIKLLEDPAVEDILSYARAALLAGDNLSLAETLKSPFFNVDEESLYALAQSRGNASLWKALADRANENPEWTRAHEEIIEARAIGLREGAFAFFSHLLETGAPSGRKRLFSRLGEASAQPLNEFMRQALDYERSNPRSLQGFLVWTEQKAGEIKRDMEEASDAVRVMTVHGAKGLEANIVFLLDAHRPPNLKQLGPLFFRDGLPVLSANQNADSAFAATARDDAKRRAYEEYRRLLYVAATRAQDRLYLCAVEPGNEKDPHKKAPPEKSWHALAEDAFARLDGEAEDAGEAPWGGRIWRHVSKQTAKIEEKQPTDHRPLPRAPGWLQTAAEKESPPLQLSPSRLADEAESKAEPAAYSPAGATDRYFRGRVLHRLLELLPQLARKDRESAADRLLLRLAGDIDDAERARWREEVFAVIDHPDFAAVFAPGSRAEVSVAGAPRGARAGLVISGQIDRLAVERDRVLIVDYKTNRPPPARIEDASPAYVAQMAAYRALLQEIYPGHQIEAALLWTYDARLMAVPANLLDHAFARHLA